MSEEPTVAAEVSEPLVEPALMAPEAAQSEAVRSEALRSEAVRSEAVPSDQKDPWSNANLPWEGKPRRVDIACWAGITVSGLFYLCLLPFRASLVGTHPLVLVVLTGSTEGIVSAAASARVGHGSLALVLLASIPGQMKFDLLYWWAGRLWGERIIELFSGRGKRSAKFVARVHRLGRWATWPAVVLSPFLPIPNALVYAVAGWTGMRWLTFLILDIIGSLAWAGMLAGLGYALGQHAVSVAQEISKYGLWVSIAVVILVIASQMRKAARTR